MPCLRICSIHSIRICNGIPGDWMLDGACGSPAGLAWRLVYGKVQRVHSVPSYTGADNKNDCPVLFETCFTLPAQGATAGLPQTRAYGQHLDKALTMSSASSHGNAALIRRWAHLHNSLHAVAQCMQRGLVQQPGLQPMLFMSRQGTAASPAASLPMLAPCYQERHALESITVPLCSHTLRTR